MKFLMTENKITYNENGFCAEMEFDVKGDVLHIFRTFVAEELRGKKIAEKLLLEVINYAHDHNFKITSSCSYVEKWFLKNDEYKYILK